MVIIALGACYCFLSPQCGINRSVCGNAWYGCRRTKLLLYLLRDDGTGHINKKIEEAAARAGWNRRRTSNRAFDPRPHLNSSPRFISSKKSYIPSVLDLQIVGRIYPFLSSVGRPDRAVVARENKRTVSMNGQCVFARAMCAS